MDKEPEVLDVKNLNGASPLQKGLAVFLMIMSLLYTVSPVDLAPDAIPVVGWLDDVGFFVTATMNAVQQFTNPEICQMVYGHRRRNRCAVARRIDRRDRSAGGEIIYLIRSRL